VHAAGVLRSLAIRPVHFQAIRSDSMHFRWIPGPWKPTCMLGVLCITQLNESLLVTKREPRVLKFQLHGS